MQTKTLGFDIDCQIKKGTFYVLRKEYLHNKTFKHIFFIHETWICKSTRDKPKIKVIKKIKFYLFLVDG